MSEKDYLSATWDQKLTSHGLSDFDTLWEMPLNPIDKPNVRRGGTSQSFLMSLPPAQGPTPKFVVKRQRNYLSRTLIHPLHGIPTLRKEFHNIQFCHRLNIPTAETVLYAERHGVQGHRVILITEFLDGYVSLNQLAHQWQQHGYHGNGQKTSILDTVAHLIRKLHKHRLQHGHLYPKHILVKMNDQQVDARLIDLEGLNHILIGNRYRLVDLSALYRRMGRWNNADKMQLMHKYLQADHLDKPAQLMVDNILKRSAQKNARETQNAAAL